MSDYIASSPEELQAMLDSLGLKDLDALTGHLPEAVDVYKRQLPWTGMTKSSQFCKVRNSLIPGSES